VVTTTPNPIRRPTSVATVVSGLPATLAYAFVYDNVTDRKAMTLGNGITETNDFDAVHRPTSIAWSGLAGLTLGYDNVGNVASIADNTSSAVPTPFWWTTYAYAGNRLDNVTDSVLRHFLYDADGNTTEDGLRTFIYNQGQRLLQVRQGATVLVENEYDGKGRRVIKRVNNGATVTVFHYDLSDRLIAETDPSGNLKVEYVYLEGRPLAQIRHTGPSEAAYYYHADHLGTPRMMTSGSGTVVWRVETDPFGNEIGTPLTTVENNLRFPGQYFDTETGLHQNYFRDYDPKTGRYIQADPLGLEGGVNPYGYVSANPLSAIDPFGLYESHWLLRAIVPGQVFYDYGRTAIENRQFGLATIYFGSMLAEQGFFAWSFGGTQVIRALATLAEREAARTVGQSVFKCAARGAGDEMVSLYRAVGDAELKIIQSTGRIPPSLSGLEGKYFSATADGAASYARQAVRGFGDAPYTLVETQVPRSSLPAEIIQQVDRNVPSILLPNTNLPLLGPVNVWPHMPLP
jgi:RHS repeat-associated protein